MEPTLNPGARPRRLIGAVLVVVVLAAVAVVAAVVGTPEPAQASGLERFASCAELRQWGASSSTGFTTVDSMTAAEDVAATTVAPQSSSDGAAFDTVGAPIATSAEEEVAASTGSGAAADRDATNVVVEGVDELDLVERVDGDVWLATSEARLVLVDLGAEAVLAGRDVAWDAQVTYDPDAGIAWVIGSAADASGVVVERVAVGDGLDDAGRWTVPGMLVDARRVGGELHLVATDGFMGIAEDAVPFAGGPVPCDQVLHPAGPSDPTATLLVTLPATGELAPLRSAEVVGSGQLVHVTDDAAYLATPQWAEDGTPSTTLHRFDLASLTHTGSGTVPGTLLNDFAMSEYDGHLRVAVTLDGGVNVGFGGGPIPIDGPAVVVDDVAPGSDGDGTTSAGASDGSAGFDAVTSSDEPVSSEEPVADEPSSDEPVAEEPVGEEPAVEERSVPTTAVPRSAPRTETESESEVGAPVTTVPEVTIPVEPGPDSSVPTTSVPETTVPETSVPEPAPTEPTTTLPPETILPAPTPSVTQVPTPTVPDPSQARNQVFVLDTSGDLDVVGQTERFGHPGETLYGIRFVDDTAYAVTFMTTDPFYVLDLADPTAPVVTGELELPGFSAYLHPVGDGLVVGFGPGAEGMPEAKLFDATDPAAPTLVGTVALGGETPVTYDHHAFVDLGDGRFAVPVTSWGFGPAADIAVDCPPNAECVMPPTEATNQVLVLEVRGGQLREVERIDVASSYPASRVLPLGDGGWAVLAGQELAIAGGPTLSLA